MKVVACILSAGLSKRMGFPKALIRLSPEDTFLSHIVKTLKEAGVYEIIVTVSNTSIRDGSKNLSVHWLLNQHPEKGQLFSFQLCVKEILRGKLNETAGVLLVPVDHPLVKLETYRKILEHCQERKIVVPIYEGKRGHPTLFPRELYSEILEAPLEVGARYLLKKHRDSVLEVSVDDPGVLIDLDTPDDLEKYGITRL